MCLFIVALLRSCGGVYRCVFSCVLLRGCVESMFRLDVGDCAMVRMDYVVVVVCMGADPATAAMLPQNFPWESNPSLAAACESDRRCLIHYATSPVAE